VVIITELPENNELVLATVKKIMPYGAFLELTEYNKHEAFLHISEVAPRWIKNIHEFISEGQRLVVKVHRVDKEKNQIDVSLKRVNEEEKKNKLAQVSFEKRAQKLIEVAVKESKSKLSADEVKSRIEEEYGDLFSCLKECSEKGEPAIKDIDLPKAVKASIVEIAKKNIKKQVVSVGGIITLSCSGSDGLETIKKALTIKDKDVEILYLGAPRYKISLKTMDYKTGEKKLSSIVESIEEFAEKNHCTFSFEEE
jgi:translation initiation factor 2 subunit 1